MGLELDYFYNNQTEKFMFYRIPKVLIQSRYYKNISLESKLLYSFMLDRTSLSIKKGYFDEQGKIYIIYTLESIQEEMGRGHNACIRYLKELEDIGLIERHKQGQGNPTIIYVKNFATEFVMDELLGSKKTDESDQVLHSLSNEEVKTSRKWKSGLPERGSQDFLKEEVKTSQKGKSRLPERGNQDFPKGEVQTSEKRYSRLPEKGSADFRKEEALNNTDLNDTENSYISSSLSFDIFNDEEKIISQEMMDWISFVRTEIDYEDLVKEFPNEKKLIDKFIEVIISIFKSDDENIRVNSKYKSKKVVVSQLMKIKADNIRNVIQKFREFKKIGKPMSENYILTCLYNSLNVYNVEKSGVDEEDTTGIGTEKFYNFNDRDYDFVELEKRFARN